MNVLSKIIFTIVSISLLTLLLFITYLTSAYSGSEKPFYEKIKLWLFEVKNENNIFSLKETNNIEKWDLFVKKLDYSDKIFFSTWNIDIQNNNWITTITLTNWMFFFDFKKINSNYIIKWKWFEIKNKWPWYFIINSINPNRNIVFSLNSLIDLKLKNYNTNENMTSVFLYPHSYLVLNPMKNVFLKNADLLKVSQNFNLWYFTEKIITNNSISKDFIDLISLKNKKDEKIIENILLIIKQDNKDKIKIYNDFLKSSFSTLTWEDFINKYSNLFINHWKMSIFHKNIIIRNLNKLLSDNKNSTDTINKIINSSKVLEKIDKDWFEEIKNIITYYYEVSLSSNININSKINLTNLINKLNNEKFILENKSLISLEKTFFDYDFTWGDSFYKEVSLFRKNYFDDLNINLKWEKTKKYSIENMEKVDYLLFFMENLLLSSDFSDRNIDTKDIIFIFNDYVKIANSFYVFNDETIKRTWLFTNSKILNKFIDILEDNYFYKERNEFWLLKLKENEKINSEDIVLLENNINEIIKFFKEQLFILKPDKITKDKIIIKQYWDLEKKYAEYFSALKNYKEYWLKYDKNKNNLLTTNSVNENNEKLVLSLNDAREYLNKFNWINLDNSLISIMDYNYCILPDEKTNNIVVELPYCYKIENLNIDWRNISFLLHPFEENKIDEISIEDKSKAWSYKLNEIKTILDEKIKTSSSEDREKYDFYNFMINTFWQKVNNYENVNNFVINEEETIEEDSVIKIFKRNKLLWDNWDFKTLNWFLDINYNDLIVTKLESWEYSIDLKSSIMNINLPEGQSFYWNFSSIYNFSTKHSFINPKIKLIDKNSEVELLLWNTLDLIWEYKVNTVNEEIKKVFEYLNEIDYIANSIKKATNITDIKIKYLKSTNQIYFESIYKGKKLFIKLFDWNIIKLTYNNVDYLKSSKKYTNIDNILKNITK